MASVDLTVKELVDNPDCKAVLEKHLPGVTSNPMLPMAYGMTLRAVSALPQAAAVGMKPELLDAIDADLKNLP